MFKPARVLAALALISVFNCGLPAAEAQYPRAVPRAYGDNLSASQRNIFATYRVRIFLPADRVEAAEAEGFIHFESTADGGVFVGSGTGFAIGKFDVVSAGHVAIEGAAFFLDVFDEDGIYDSSIPMTVVKADRKDPNNDLALFKTLIQVPRFIKPTYGNAKVGDWCYTVGARYGQMPYLVGWGNLATKQHETFPGMWMASINAAPGNSGGPVFNSKNQLLGVLVRGMPGVVLFINNDILRAFLSGE